MGFGMINGMASLSRGIQDQSTVMSLGAETNLGPVSLRAGFRSDSGIGSSSSVGSQGGAAGIMSGFTTGMGLHFGAFRLDYALGQDVQDLGLSHRASIAFQFGRKVQ